MIDTVKDAVAAAYDGGHVLLGYPTVREAGERMRDLEAVLDARGMAVRPQEFRSGRVKVYRGWVWIGVVRDDIDAQKFSGGGFTHANAWALGFERVRAQVLRPRKVAARRVAPMNFQIEDYVIGLASVALILWWVLG